MAVSDDLTFGHDFDDQLDVIRAEMPDAFDSEPVAMVAALMKLDEMLGVHEEGDYVLVTPSFMIWLLLMVTPNNPVIAEMMNQEDEQDEAVADRLLVENVFDVTMTNPESDEYDVMYPESIRGKIVQLRCMNSKEEEYLPTMCTVRKNGTVIELPKYRHTW